MLRVIIYWVSCLSFIFIPLLLGRIWNDPSRLFYEHAPPLWQDYGTLVLLSILALPLVLFDMLKYSNRVTGPVFRTCNELNALADGNDVRPIVLREGDAWQELAEAFNRVANELREARRAVQTAGTRSGDQDAPSTPETLAP